MEEISLAPSVADTDVILNRLANVMAQAEAAPQNVPLIRRQIHLMSTLEMQPEVLDTCERLSALVMLDEATWFTYFDILLASTPKPVTLDAFVTILEAFDRAEQDYMSIDLLLRHLNFVIACSTSQNESSTSDSVPVDGDVSKFLVVDTLRGMLAGIVSKGEDSISESHKLWQPWVEWEVGQIANGTGRSEAIARIQSMYLNRLRIPHNVAMVQATEASQLSKIKLSGEKRYGKTREDFEQQLQYTPEAIAKIPGFVAYAAWEADSRAKAGGRGKMPHVDTALVVAVFERTVACYAGACANMQTSLEAAEDTLHESRSLSKGKSKQKANAAAIVEDKAISTGWETIRAYKDAEALIWLKYAHWAESTLSASSSAAIRQRAVRACPQSGETWVDCMLAMAERRAPKYLEQVLAIVGQPNKARSSSYQMTLLLADTLSKAIHRSDLDWPEAVFEAFLQFEQLHGSLDSLLEAKKAISREQEKLVRRREKAAAESQDLVTPANPENAVAVEVGQVDVPADTLQEITLPPASAAPLVQSDVPAKRIQAFFQECGIIREITILRGEQGNLTAALIEFAQADSVPAALAKHRKKLDGDQISISMLWRSTLFVTNFQKEMDDGNLRNLFSQYGTILQTRWPSRKYSDTRRFCYVTMESPAAAQEALVLNGFKSPGAEFGLTVLVSDPSARAKRSDASDADLFVGGLKPSTTETDVRELLKDVSNLSEAELTPQYGLIRSMNLAEAQACIAALHGVQYQGGRLLNVAKVDKNHAKRGPVDDRRSRLVQLSNLPEGTQEGLLQQALEKIVPVKRLELFTKTNEAVAELESQVDVGKLLLGAEPFEFDGQRIVFSEQNRRSAVEAATPVSATSFAPRATRKGKVLAKPRPTAVAAAKSTPLHSTGQDSFRALVEAQNKKREENLANAKRKSDQDESAVKRSRYHSE
ncbi:hypothetical protein IAU60_003578 [Kwoniella sp. DSM 27419]